MEVQIPAGSKGHFLEGARWLPHWKALWCRCGHYYST